MIECYLHPVMPIGLGSVTWFEFYSIGFPSSSYRVGIATGTKLHEKGISG